MKKLTNKAANGLTSFAREISINRTLYLMALPGIVFFIIFAYIPMYYVIISFKDYNPMLGVFGSPWVGLEHFIRLFDSVFFIRIIKNTVGLSTYAIVASFWVPIVFALLLNEIRHIAFKRVVQTITYIPHFVSMVVLCGMITSFCMKDGIINDIIALFGGERTNLLMRPELFKTIYVLSGIWESVGWSSIVYVAALTGINPALYEAAEIDGAGRFKKAWHITLPGIIPTIVTMLILNIGTIMSVGFEKVFLLYNPLTYETAEVISTYVYNKGLVEMNFSFATAANLFNSVVNLLLVLISNYISRKVTETGLW
jgi:putative aldouronate transport system permease protein